MSTQQSSTSTNDSLRIAICQLAATPEKSRNLQLLEPWVREAREQGADLAILPEYVMYMPDHLSTAVWDAAEGLDGPFTREVQRLAAAYDVTILCNIAEARTDSKKPFNTQIAVDTSGEIIHLYRKVHLYDAHGYTESEFFSAGEELGPAVIDVQGWRIALQICYDLRFPEAARAAAHAGAEVLVYATAWTSGPRKEDQWATLVRARAIENALFVAASVQAAPKAIGGSLMVDPMGVVEGDAGAGEALLVRQLDKTKISTTRAENPVLDNCVYKI